MLIKGEWLYETDPDTGMIKKHRFCEHAGVFINIHEENFDVLPLPERPGIPAAGE